MLIAGVLVGALYNPWTGSQTRHWLLEKIASDDELAPLDVETSQTAESPVAAAVATNGGETN